MPSNVNTTIAFHANKLSSRFPTKDKTKKDHQHNVVYKVNCHREQCTYSNIGETFRRLKERILDHDSRDKNSACLRHSKNTGHPYVNKRRSKSTCGHSNFHNYDHFLDQVKRKLDVCKTSCDRLVGIWSL